MDIATAKLLLNDCKRSELRDHAFGDREVFWMKDERVIASGYYGGVYADVHFHNTDVSFKDDEARTLKDCGNLVHVERNDMMEDY